MSARAGNNGASNFPISARSSDSRHRASASARAETGWVLLDATVHAVADGFCSVTADLWAEDGTLLGTASQTLVLRELKPGGALPDRTRRITGG